MKKLSVFLSLMFVVCATVLMSACSSPRTKDTSDVAGKYYQHEGNILSGVVIEDKWIKLNDDGTWETGAETEASRTFKLDGENIKIYFDGAETMHGTIKDGKLELKVFAIIGWEDSVFFKEAE